MRLVRILSASDPLAARVPELYEEAFPIQERTETSRFLRAIEDCDRMTFYAVLDEDDSFAGMAVLWDLGLCRYLHYLAVVRQKRLRGIGSFVLTALKKESDLPILLEVEPPVEEIQKRRIGFYERHGFHIESKNPLILNAAHSHKDCVLMLMASEGVRDLEECQRRIVDTAYKGMHGI